MPAGAPPHSPRGESDSLHDALFLTGIVVLSALLYVGGFGLYSDDWALLELMHGAADQSLTGLYDSLLPTGIGTRPIQGVWLAVLYSLFGLEPLGYHLANLALLAATVVLFHLCLRELGLPRVLALTVPLVFAMLPHYSTGRIWIAAFQAPLSVLLYLVSLYSDIRFTRGARASRWPWKIAGTVALLASVLAYEITAALFLLNPFLLWLAFRHTPTVPHGRTPRRGLRVGIVLGSNILALALALAYKSASTERAGLLAGGLWWIRYAAENATTVAFGSYGLGLPLAVGRVLRSHLDPPILAVSLLIGVTVWLYLGRSLGSASLRAVSRWVWLRLIGLGLLAFAAGYGVVLFTLEVGFDTTGMHNRTAQAAALGVAVTFVALVGWASSWLPNARQAWGFFRGALALLAAAGCLLVNTIAAHWVEAANRQEEVIAAVEAHLTPIPRESVILLDGLCRYVGPGVVFETQWDVTGMLRLEFGDASLRGDVITARTEATPEGVRTILYDDVVHVYPYGSSLVTLDVASGDTRVLDTREDAERYLAAGSRVASCAPGQEGYGSRIF